MSYGFTINFKHCPTFGDAMLTANKVSELIYANLDAVLEDEECFIPSVRYSFRDIAERERQIEDRAWLHRLLTLNFVWWPQYRLLGFVGPTWPKEALDVFTGKVYFQNSCDQDYEFSEWESFGVPFKAIVSECQNGDIETVKKYLNLGREEYPVELEPEDTASEENFAYYRRWAAYNGIYETLRLDRWLRGHEDPAFMRVSITPLTSSEREFEAEQKLKAFVKNSKEDGAE